MNGECANCGCKLKNLKRGWTNDLYCGDACEWQAVNRLRESRKAPGPYLGMEPGAEITVQNVPGKLADALQRE
jgi:hypothetical protein